MSAGTAKPTLPLKYVVEGVADSGVLHRAGERRAVLHERQQHQALVQQILGAVALTDLLVQTAREGEGAGSVAKHDQTAVLHGVDRRLVEAVLAPLPRVREHPDERGHVEEHGDGGDEAEPPGQPLHAAPERRHDVAGGHGVADDDVGEHVADPRQEDGEHEDDACGAVRARGPSPTDQKHLHGDVPGDHPDAARGAAVAHEELEVGDEVVEREGQHEPCTLLNRQCATHRSPEPSS
ncbi:tRNA N6-adenosine threonylcarbamoyltransferase, putative [Babesia caballi]|uniref:tRNA N6-adenosine threonylcarbamoyltransferase, putative n=1 Tax=Babesia caballi TaxID=5871 RepID=A0AAV4LZR8_BABCB|nr:tRNA N6-adenosine threonylcarbamoyltransferase, putative [Babesia caballi]